MYYLRWLLFLLFSLALFYSVEGQNSNIKSSQDTTKNIRINLNHLLSEDEKEQAEADSVIQQYINIDNLLEFTNNWKVKSGDDTLWKEPKFDDSAWDEIADSARDNKNYLSIVWYRMHFDIDSSLLNRPLAFILHLYGSAAEVYLDGKLLKKFGTVASDLAGEEAVFNANPQPIAIVFSQLKDHVLAIRYSNFHRTSAKISGFNIGQNFIIKFKDLNDEINDALLTTKKSALTVFVAAIFLTLAIVHFIMFLYYRQKITNLYYSLYCIGIFIFAFYTYHLVTSTNYASIAFISKSLQFLAPLMVVPIVAMLHTIFYQRFRKILWIIIGAYGLMIILYFFTTRNAANLVLVILMMISFVEILRVIIVSVRKKRDGAWIFAMTLFLPVLLGVVTSILPDQMSFSGMNFEIKPSQFVFASMILGLPFSVALYLARDFARMGKTLTKQIGEITELSTKTIRQEQEKKQLLENQKTILEFEVKERTREVLDQKNVIEIKNREVTESLHYAKRIQAAILPDIKKINQSLQDLFILYLPKDIVSGDFYSFAQRDEKIIVAAADCTGHGVAGAFMSMIGTALLNQIVNEKDITEPSEILTQLNDGIVTSLKQRESEMNEGMDIALCTINNKSKTLQYSGANRPLWIIRNNEFQYYKPNKLPIGGQQYNKTDGFMQHNITLEQGDSIYLFSDGYVDQFGGDLGKKFMTKKFRELLLSIQHLSMNEQKEYLLNTLIKWQGKHDQVDDILVIGIKIP
jgi:serine phosphatase RsbU (regulator of sigma subunit)